jgi:hypothetical protein
VPADHGVVPADASTRGRRALFTCYLAFVAVYTLVFAYLLAHGRSNYIIGDWLINYSGGFVRRGLIGTLVMAVHRAMHVPFIWIICVLQSMVYVVFVVCVYRLTRGIRWTFPMAAILLSPSTLAFTVIESFAGLRKEELLYAALALWICVVISGRLRDWQLSALLTAMVVVLVLSHEALVVGLPYMFAALLIQTGDWKRSLKISLAPMLLGGTALVAVMLHPGNLAITEAVCSSVGGHLGPTASPADICSGSIQWLQYNVVQARAQFVPIIQETHMVRLFSLLVVLTMTPIVAQLVLFYRRDGLRREMGVLLGCGLIAMCGTATLFYTALDWGRWVHMEAVCLMLMVLMIDPRAPRDTVPAGSPFYRNPWLRVAASLAVFIYATTWKLPSIGSVGGGYGYIDNIHMIRHWMPGPPQ